MNVGKVLAQCAQRFPDKTAVIFAHEQLSFDQINCMARRIGNTLRKLGVTRGERVALMLPNSSHFVIAYFGILKLGAVCVPLDPRLKGEEIRGIIENAKIKVCITSGELYDNFASFLKKHSRVTIVVGKSTHVSEEECISFEEIVGDETLSEEVEVEVGPNEEALYLYTSGTIGIPKGVVLTFNNLRLFPETLSEMYNTNESEVMGCILPMSHISGPILCNELVDKGSTLVIFNQIRPDKVLATVEKHRVTWFHAVPPIFQAILRIPQLSEYDVSSLRFIAMMGTSIPLDLLQSFKKQFPSIKVIQGYGLTETSPFITLVPPEYERQKMGSMGVAVPHAEIKLVDGKGKEVAVGEGGELIVKGPMVMKGYHHNPEATRERIKDGWLYTGDLCRKDEDGFYYYLGRKDDMIIVGGLNVFPFEVESILTAHPQVVEAAAVGIPAKERGKIIKAVVVVAPGSSLTEKELISFCRNKLANYKVLKTIELWKTLPKTSTGKIARRLLVNAASNVSSCVPTTH